jgi:electron transport complex protein RnfA
MHGVFEMMAVALTALFAENFLLVTCMGVGTRLSAFRDPKDALRTGNCLTMVMVVSTLLAWCIDVGILRHFRLSYFRTYILALLVPAVVWCLRQFLRLFIPELYRRNNQHLRSVTTNCAALGCVLLVTQRSYGLGAGLLFALCGGLGTTVVLANFAHLMGEADLEQCPKCFKGLPIQLITAGLMAMGLVGFYGLHFHLD